ncbi:hypothetical protein [Actinomadura rubrisoli]|uniref:Uncharacterized protein n=1 Tax=Actinomadura rubrisoli TaxID=2530368 RepID=A0A4R5C0G6_9ACTN|nr:hypothetical protein [Actinomadura rubrisoli]TDD93058.1 hypothetical protein E1298_10290 [Actinomadura rubrisoli]
MNRFIHTGGKAMKALVALSTGAVLGLTGLADAGIAQERPATATGRTSGPMTYGKGVTVQQALKAEVARRGAAAYSVCYQAHVAYLNWQNVTCNGGIAGTVGRNLAIEAVNVAVSGATFCVEAHIRDKDWQGEQCARDQWLHVGTEGQNRPMEALRFWVGGPTKEVGQAHVQDWDWLGVVANNYDSPLRIELGTTGRGLMLEAFTLQIVN